MVITTLNSGGIAAKAARQKRRDDREAAWPKHERVDPRMKAEERKAETAAAKAKTARLAGAQKAHDEKAQMKMAKLP